MKSDLTIHRPPDEEFLYGVWARRGFDPRKLRTVDGARTQVVFPGRRNGGAGPDFLDASVDVEGRGLLRGDVEIHVRARDWMSHGHHRDPAYNGVVLHVVWDADSLWTEREDGQHVPTAPLKGCLQTSVEADSEDGVTGTPPLGRCDEIASALGAEQVARLLDEAGDERFAAKAVRFQGEMAVWPPSEVLYQDMMRALGYSKNRAPFLALARLLPWSTVEALAASTPQEELPRAIAAWLLGTAGLLQGAGSDIEDIWRRSLLTREMRPSDWRLAGVRPANHPSRRILGAGDALARFTDEGLVEGFERAFLIADHHKDPGLLIDLTAAPPAIGSERAREMVVNVVLPFFRAFGLEQKDGALAGPASFLFELAPPGPGNRKLKDMSAQLGIGRPFGVPMTARREQGLVHLIEGACRHGWCAECPLGRAAPRHVALTAAS